MHLQQPDDKAKCLWGKPAHELSDVFLESFFDSSAAGEKRGSTGCCLQPP